MKLEALTVGIRFGSKEKSQEEKARNKRQD